MKQKKETYINNEKKGKGENFHIKIAHNPTEQAEIKKKKQVGSSVKVLNTDCKNVYPGS